MNRRRLAAALPAGAIAVIATGRYAQMCGGDSAAPWPDFYYLTGRREPQSALILEGGPGHHGRTILFTPPRDRQRTLWEGPAEPEPPGVEVRPMTAFESTLCAVAFDAETVLVHAPENPFAPQEDNGLAALCRRLLPLHPVNRLAPLLGRLRAEKSAGEIASLRKANELAAAAFRRAIGLVRPGIRGFEVKAGFLYGITQHGSAGFCCPPITAAGAETLTLHWNGDRRPWAAGETALLDFTAEWNGCCADVARVVPVSGRFTPRQRAVYEAVVRLLTQATAAVRPGRLLRECQHDAAMATQQELLRLGLLKSGDVPDPSKPAPALQGFFMHRAFHHLGMEVHDPVPAGLPLAPGHVLAVEPGIYIPDEGFGIRLENNLLVTPAGAENLTAGLPVEAGAIEDLLQV